MFTWLSLVKLDKNKYKSYTNNIKSLGGISMNNLPQEVIDIIYGDRGKQIENFKFLIKQFCDSVIENCKNMPESEKQAKITGVIQNLISGKQTLPGIVPDDVARAILLRGVSSAYENIEYNTYNYHNKRNTVLDREQFNLFVEHLVRYCHENGVQNSQLRDNVLNGLYAQLGYIKSHSQDDRYIIGDINSYLIAEVFPGKNLKNQAELAIIAKQSDLRVQETAKRLEEVQRQYDEALANANQSKAEANNPLHNIDEAILVTTSKHKHDIEYAARMILKMFEPDEKFDYSFITSKKIGKNENGSEIVLNDSVRDNVIADAKREPLGISIMKQVLLCQQKINDLTALGKPLPNYLGLYQNEIKDFASEFSKYTKPEALKYLNSLQRDQGLKQSLAMLFVNTRYDFSQMSVGKEPVVHPEMLTVAGNGPLVNDTLSYAAQPNQSDYTL